MRRLALLAALVLLFAAGCGGDDGADGSAAPPEQSATAASSSSDGPSSTQPTTTAKPTSTTTGRTVLPGCPQTYKAGTLHGAPPECWPTMLEATLDSFKVIAYDRLTAEAQARVVCDALAFGTTGEVQMLRDWESGAQPSPVANPDDRPEFLLAVAAVYCPQYWEVVHHPG